MTEICRGYNLGSGKQLLAIKVSFCINKPGFQELMSELATRSLPRRLTFMTYISKNRTAIYLKFCSFPSFMPIINCTKVGINQIILTVLPGVWAKKPPPPEVAEKNLKCRRE